MFGNLQGLPRQGKFGFHFHEFPVENEDCESAGEHFNVSVQFYIFNLPSCWNWNHFFGTHEQPYAYVHGGKDSGIRHTGDLGNVVSQYSGTAHLTLTDHRISLGQGLNSVLGRSLVVSRGMIQFFSNHKASDWSFSFLIMTDSCLWRRPGARRWSWKFEHWQFRTPPSVRYGGLGSAQTGRRKQTKSLKYFSTNSHQESHHQVHRVVKNGRLQWKWRWNEHFVIS